MLVHQACCSSLYGIGERAAATLSLGQLDSYLVTLSPWAVMGNQSPVITRHLFAFFCSRQSTVRPPRLSSRHESILVHTTYRIPKLHHPGTWLGRRNKCMLCDNCLVPGLFVAFCHPARPPLFVPGTSTQRPCEHTGRQRKSRRVQLHHFRISNAKEPAPRVFAAGQFSRGR